MGYKICVYGICKNESAFADRWMDSMGEADMVVVADTGSDDDTVERLKNRGADVIRAKVTPWRFDVARNISLSHVPKDVDICVCTDLDEVFEPGWRERLEAAWSPNCTRARYLFTSEFDADNKPRKQFVKEKMHRRHGFRWVHPVHEVLEYSGADKEQSIFIHGIILNHYPDHSKPRAQYLPLLELSAKENPMDSQTSFWLGREYMFHGKLDLCMAELKRYLKLETALWNEERSAAMCYIAGIYEARDNMKEAKAWLMRAIAECPGVREPYLKAARLGYKLADWPLTYAMVKNALAIVKPSGSYLTQTDCWGYALYDLGAISAYRLGLLYESRAYALEALEKAPNDKRLQNNLRLIEAKLGEKGGSGS